MKRRELIAGFAGAAVWPVAAPAQGHHHRQLACTGRPRPLRPLSEASAIGVSFKNELPTRCAEPG